ncbi:MAG: helicase-related protein [Pseudomonadota bacterium]|jgi:HrpA-like RNA helicase
MGSMESPKGRANLIRSNGRYPSKPVGGHEYESKGGRNEPPWKQYYPAPESPSLPPRIIKVTPTASQRSGQDLKPKSDLTIAPVLPRIMKMFWRRPVTGVVAATGVGKSIGITEMVANECRGANYSQIIVTHPRRLPAVMLAQQLATRDGTEVGKRYGYRHGAGREIGDSCQVIVTTEGHLLKKMLSENKKGGANQLDKQKTHVFIWDEAHERTAKGAILLYLWREMLKEGYDLKLVISSATINPTPIKDYFKRVGLNASFLNIAVKHYHIDDRSDGWYNRDGNIRRNQIVQDILAIKRSLTIVHGKGEIASLRHQLVSKDPRLPVIVLHGELSRSEQEQAVKRINSGGGRIAVIATNYIQTSVTLDIDGVISNGLVRRQRYGDDGECHLTIEDSSQDEEKQRRGRAGRLRPDDQYYYRGRTEKNKLALEAPHEIENCQLESLVLSVLEAGRDFRRMNQELLYKAPESQIDNAMKALYRLGLIGPKGNVTNLGHLVASLPLEVRTGKAVALALLESGKQKLYPEQLIIPTIDMVSCIEARGMLAHEASSSGPGAAQKQSNGHRSRATKLLDADYRSDPLAHMKLFQRLLMEPELRSSALGIHMGHFQAALQRRELVFERLGIDPGKLAATELDPKHLRLIQEFHWAGFIDRIYQKKPSKKGDVDGPSYRPLVQTSDRPAALRTLSRESLAKDSKLIIGDIITIDREPYDEHPVRLIVMASQVDNEWLRNNTPPQLKMKKAVLTAIIDAAKRLGKRASKGFINSNQRTRNGRR